MNKFWVIALLALIAANAADARYVRKVREPDFFIPESDRMHRPEKLPKVVVVNPRQTLQKEVFSSVPEYKTKYNKYLADMAVFSNTKVMQENAEVSADLAAMETGDVFEVTAEAPQKITAREQKEFYLLVKQILKN